MKFHHDHLEWGNLPGNLLNPIQAVYLTPSLLAGTTTGIIETYRNDPLAMWDYILERHDPQNRTRVTVGDLMDILKQQP